MPDISNIDSEKILSSASQLDGIVGRISTCVAKFDDAIATLDKGWVSEVKGGFMANYGADQGAAEEMLAQLQEINDGLRGAATDFDKSESDILTAVRALK